MVDVAHLRAELRRRDASAAELVSDDELAAMAAECQNEIESPSPAAVIECVIVKAGEVAGERRLGHRDA